MRIFLDTANIEEIREAAKLGVVSGVTTNPSLVAKEEWADLKAVIQEICSIIEGPISAEVLSTEPEAMIAAAKAGAHIATVPYPVLMQMIRHPLTDVGVARFAQDWQRVASRI
jgi:transaldolase